MQEQIRNFITEFTNKQNKSEQDIDELKNNIVKYGEKTLLNWQGPNKNKRDFVFDKTAVEIKSTGSQIDPNILISNENR